MKVALNLLLILVASLLCLFAVEALTRLVLDDGMLYELEMWKYAREVKMRDTRPDFGHRHRPQAQARLMAMSKVGPLVAHLHFARVLPHFELVQLSLIHI